MNAKTLIILVVFTVLFIFSVVSKLFFNDFQNGWVAYEKKDYKTAHELWLPLAERGHVRAQFFLGFMHDMGFGVPEDDKKALKWYELAAEQGDSRAQLFTGYIYDHGNGVQQDYQKAVKWYQLAAEQGYKQARENIYKLAKKNSPEALKILVNDAENGDATLQYTLAVMHDTGQGVQQDYQKAVKWYQLAAEQGYKQAKDNIYRLAKRNVSEALKILVNDAENGDTNLQYTLGEMYDNGQGVQQDYKEALKWYKLAKKKGNAKAKTAIYHLAKRNVPDALKILVNDAENGDDKAQNELSMMYQLGLGVRQDYKEALKWHRFAAERKLDNVHSSIKKRLIKKNIQQTLKALSNDAENGDTEAQMSFGLMYQLGIEVPIDEKKAVKWYRFAAEQGARNAKYIMGLMYYKGQGVAQDDREALKWYRLAEINSIYNLAKQNVPQALKILTEDAENGIVEAQYKLGAMYSNGSGVQYDPVLAHMWYNLSALQGRYDVAAQISSLEKKMSAQQIEQAQEMVKNWKPKE